MPLCPKQRKLKRGVRHAQYDDTVLVLLVTNTELKQPPPGRPATNRKNGPAPNGGRPRIRYGRHFPTRIRLMALVPLTLDKTCVKAPPH